MILQKLEMENWKCFRNKKILNFDKHEIISDKNGSGKSSTFDAIYFAVTGKLPAGFNMNTIRYDDSKQARVYLEFQDNLSEISVERIFGANPSISLIVNDQLVAENVRAANQWLESVFNSRILSILWTQNLVSSDSLSARFFTDTILEDLIREPEIILSHYTREVYSANREINRFNELNKGKILDLKLIEENLKEVESKLKGNASISKQELIKARNAESSVSILKELDNIPNLVKDIDINRFKRIYKYRDQIEKDLVEEMKKKDTIYSRFSHSEIIKIIEASLERNKCVICNGNMNEEHIQYIREEISLSNRSESRIEELKSDLKLISLCSIDVIDKYEKWSQAKKNVDLCPNYKEIIESWSEENNRLWDEFNKLQDLKLKAERQLEDLRKIEELRKDVVDWRNRIEVIKNWIEEARETYTEKLMVKASEYLSSINSRYKEIGIYDKEFVVVVENEDLALNLLPVSRLSSGEKTICALSLLFAIHNIFVPNIPLLFDETFSALDRENLTQVQRFLSKQDTQIFIITHDQTWQEI